MTDPMAELAADPALARAAARLRAEWRAEEEEWTAAEAQRWAHRRCLADLAREALHRGDTLAVTAAGVTFRGTLTRVGADWLQLELPGGLVDVALTQGLAPAPAGAVPAPVVLQRLERARAGGRRDDGAVATLRARLRELEARGEPVAVGSTLLAGEIQGRLTVGADHVVVTGDGVETALAWLSWVREARDPAWR